MHSEITIVRTDSICAGQPATWAKSRLGLTLKAVSRPRNTPAFVILPRAAHLADRLAPSTLVFQGRPERGGEWGPSASVVVLIRVGRECPWPVSGQEVRR